MSFPETRWTLVARAKGQGADAERALSDLLAAYWPALYVLARYERLSPSDAQDAVQSFSAHLLEKRVFALADPARGRLRSFLKTSFKHFLSDERARGAASKRGGGSVSVEVEEALLRDLSADPEQAFARRWAQLVMARALTRLEAETERFAIVRAYFGGELPALATVAEEHGMSVPQLKSFLHRARARYRALLLEETRETTDDAEQELAELLALVSA